MMQYSHHYQLQTGMTYKLLTGLFVYYRSKQKSKCKNKRETPSDIHNQKEKKETIPSILQKIIRQQTVKQIQ